MSNGTQRLKAVETSGLSGADDTRGAVVSPVSQELIVGMVGYAGAGCSVASTRLQRHFGAAGYTVYPIKLSSLIEHFSGISVDAGAAGAPHLDGTRAFERAKRLQDEGDRLRKQYRPDAVAVLAVREIVDLRGDRRPGEARIVLVLDSIKHRGEVEFLREVYGPSFRLVAVHCERAERERRLLGSLDSVEKYAGVREEDIRQFLDRDESDDEKRHGQQVRDAFCLADFFVDNNGGSSDGAEMSEDLKRFMNLALGIGMVRPNSSERAMYHAHSAALQSSCLSRQVGASLMAASGEVVATGTNDAPKFDGGVYDEESTPDRRCFAWEWENGNMAFKGCHNTRKKRELARNVAAWLAEQFAPALANIVHPTNEGFSVHIEARNKAENNIRDFLGRQADKLDEMPGIRELLEYSRSIHAEMDALLAAARNGISPRKGKLFCTTFPCHNCARHLVAAGIVEVRYIEPYTKSLAVELHYDSISIETSKPGLQDRKPGLQDRMIIAPFTGVGPRMFDDFFKKRGTLKRNDGSFTPPEAAQPVEAIRLRALHDVETKVTKLMPENKDE